MAIPKISVIVPVYKAEAYLHRCVDSILAQTFKDIEVLLINDGSPDGSGEICNEYSHMDSRIRVFHKENGGVSSARQCGLDNAVGEYVIHVDPDDWIEKDMYERMYSVAVDNNADIVGCDFFVEYNKKDWKVCVQPFFSDPTTCLRLIFEEKLHSGCCNKLIKRRLFVDNNVFFPEGVNLWEDISTIPKIFYYSKVIKYISSPFYHYVQYNNPNSYTHNCNISSLRQKEKAVKILDKFFNGTIVSNYLCYLKLSVRLSFIQAQNGQDRRIYYRLYPEADRYIFQHPKLSVYNKLILWTGIYCNCIPDILIVIKHVLKKII